MRANCLPAVVHDVNCYCYGLKSRLFLAQDRSIPNIVVVVGGWGMKKDKDGGCGAIAATTVEGNI